MKTARQILYREKSRQAANNRRTFSTSSPFHRLAACGSLFHIIFLTVYYKINTTFITVRPMTPATSKSTGKGTTKNNGDSKPLTTFAPPPMSAVVSIVVFIGVAIYYLPTGTDVPPEIFVNRVFPEYLSVEAMLFIRAFFALVCFGGFASGWLTAE